MQNKDKTINMLEMEIENKEEDEKDV